MLVSLEEPVDLLAYAICAIAVVSCLWFSIRGYEADDPSPFEEEENDDGLPPDPSSTWPGRNRR